MKVIFSDLDGTLLDSQTDSFQAAEPTLLALRKQGTPLVLSTGKTRVKVWRDRLHIRHPFTVENRGAIYIPKSYFRFTIDEAVRRDNHDVIVFGTRMGNLSAAYGEAACKTGSEVLGFPDMTVTEIRHRASLPGTQAELAKQREYDEPFEILGSEIHTLLAAIERRENAGLHEYRRQIKLCCIVPVSANIDGQNGSGILIIHLG